MKKRAITLLEIMIVIFLIALIGGVVGFNMKGSMDKGKAFKTSQAISRVKEILYLVASEQNLNLDEVVKNKETYLKGSSLVKKPSELLKDGWGGNLDIRTEDGRIVVLSSAYDEYNKKMGIVPEPDND